MNIPSSIKRKAEEVSEHPVPKESREWYIEV